MIRFTGKRNKVCGKPQQQMREAATIVKCKKCTLAM